MEVEELYSQDRIYPYHNNRRVSKSLPNNNHHTSTRFIFQHTVQPILHLTFYLEQLRITKRINAGFDVFERRKNG